MPLVGKDVATGWEPIELTDSEIADGEAYHRALYHEGDPNQPVDWHKKSVNKLISIAKPHIKQDSLVVDYGSGTGGSAIELMRSLDQEGVEIELIMIDPLVSWFSKAREILGKREDVHFELSTEYDSFGRNTFRRLEDILGGRKADVIISSSTLHLIPERALGDLAFQFANNLSKDGVFVWDSGDLESEFRPENSALLHDPYRTVRELLRADEVRVSALSSMAEAEIEKFERRLDRIFPSPISIQVVLDALENAGFSSEISDEVVNFSHDDARRFALVPRLAEIAAPLPEGNIRDKAIVQALNSAMKSIEDDGRGCKNEYRSHWVYGCHKLV